MQSGGHRSATVVVVFTMIFVPVLQEQPLGQLVVWQVPVDLDREVQGGQDLPGEENAGQERLPADSETRESVLHEEPVVRGRQGADREERQVALVHSDARDGGLPDRLRFPESSLTLVGEGSAT